jgi:hypothetical protein
MTPDLLARPETLKSCQALNELVSDQHIHKWPDDKTAGHRSCEAEVTGSPFSKMSSMTTICDPDSIQARRRYCADCGRWVLSLLPVTGNGWASRIVFRPGTTRVQNRGSLPAKKAGKRAGYLCDACDGRDQQTTEGDGSSPTTGR